MTAPPAAASQPWTVPLRAVGAFVDRQAAGLQKRVLRNDSGAVAALARLRRGVGRVPGELPDLLAHTHHDDFVPSRGDEPSRAEVAVHIALTHFALHQQSQTRAMHVHGRGLGAALRSLDTSHELPEALLRRFRILGTAQGLLELTHHLRGVVQLLRQAGTSLDYGLLADQLVTWQYPDGPSRVRLQWGREFYRTANITTEPDTDTEGTAP